MKNFTNQRFDRFDERGEGRRGGRPHRGGEHPRGGHGPGWGPEREDGGFGPDFHPGFEEGGRFGRDERRAERAQGRGEERGEGRGRGGRGFGRPGFGPEGPMGPMGGFGGPEGDMGGFGPMGGGRGPRGRGHRGPGRGRKGDVRNAVLALLAEQNLNGYGLINQIAEKSNGLWRPSAGSIYPALGLLEDEGLIEATEADGKKVYQLTEAGRAHAAEHTEELDEPWNKVAGPHRGWLDVRGDMQQLAMAVQQVVVAGDQEQVEATRKVLERARKDVYRLLAGDAEA